MRTTVAKRHFHEAPLVEQPWQDLKCQFLNKIDHEPEQVAESWLETWRLLVEHPWYQEQLAICSRQVLRRGKVPDEWLDDVKQEAMLLLASRLRHTPDLNVDRQRAQHHFPGWLGTIVRHHCCEALRRMRRLHRESREVVEGDVGTQQGLTMEEKIDLSLTLDRLVEPERTVVALSARDWSLREIAEASGCSYWKTRRIYLRGLEQLGRLLA